MLVLGVQHVEQLRVAVAGVAVRRLERSAVDLVQQPATHLKVDLRSAEHALVVIDLGEQAQAVCGGDQVQHARGLVLRVLFAVAVRDGEGFLVLLAH